MLRLKDQNLQNKMTDTAIIKTGGKPGDGSRSKLVSFEKLSVAALGIILLNLLYGLALFITKVRTALIFSVLIFVKLYYCSGY